LALALRARHDTKARCGIGSSKQSVAACTMIFWSRA
jgi:hypothetical protein